MTTGSISGILPGQLQGGVHARHTAADDDGAQASFAALERRATVLVGRRVAFPCGRGRAAAELAPTLTTLVSVGAMGYYGNDTGGRRLT